MRWCFRVLGLTVRKKSKITALLDAYRLPNGAFKGTDVGTDIVVLKKNMRLFWERDLSNHFEKHPQKVLGEKTTKTNRFGKQEDYIKGSLQDALKTIENAMLEKQPVVKDEIKEIKDETVENKSLQDENIAVKEEIVAEKKDAVADSQEVKDTIDKVTEALETLNNIKFKSFAVVKEIDKLQNLVQQLPNQNKTSEELKNINESTQKTIDVFAPKSTSTKEYKIQNSSEIKKGVLKYHFQKQDEVVDTGLQNSPNLTEEKLLSFQQTSYNGQIGVHESRLMKYANVYKGDLYHDFYYTEGDIYEKLEQLDTDFSKKIDWLGNADEQQKQYEKQKALLESVLPPKKALEDIIVSPNHEFVHNFSVGQQEKEVQTFKEWRFGGRNPTPIYTTEKQMVNVSLADEFKNFVRKLPREAFGQSNSWEVNSFVDNETVTGSDRERNALVRERRKEIANDLFKKFLHEELSDDLKERFVNEFNRKYNNIHIPDYTQFPLFSRIHQNFKGKPLELTEVQKAGIGRLTTKGVGLLAHEVGFGKTLSGILSMHEAMERGNAKRPLIVVPNDNILKQWVETIYETIPNAKVNVLGNLGKGYDLSKFDNKDGEITLVTYEGFNNIGFSKERTQELARNFSYITESETKSLKFSERDYQIELQKREEIQGKMKKGKVYDWEDFDFDHLTFDEVHNANHIVGKVKIEDRRFASDFRNQNQRTSQLGINTWMASQHIQEKYDGRNVTLLSATPFTNKPLEYYSILSLIANERLEKSGYFNVNNFFETFMEADMEMEIDAKGDIKNKTNVRRFKNNDLFQRLLSEYIDIKGEEDNPDLKRPNRINKEYKIEQNELTRRQYNQLNASLDETKEGAILTHILNARKIAFSPYLSNDYKEAKPTTKEFIENSPKLKTTMDLIAQNKKDKPEAGQIIYSELGVSEFPKLKEYLINEVGYKSDEVAIITGATTKNQRLDIQEKFNEGKIKVVIGSEAIQEGMNLQENTTDMYLLTLPYNFTSLRQTEGRAWRQGNKWENVRINFMLTNDSIDVFMLQKLQAKQARYMEAIKKGANVVDVSDVDTQELKTAIITDPYTRAEIEVELLKKRYEAEKNRLNADLGFVSRKFDYYINSNEFYAVKSTEERIQKYQFHADKEKENGIENGYWATELQRSKEDLVHLKLDLQKLEEKLASQGINIEDFQRQKQSTQAEIEKLDTKIKEELPIIKDNLIFQYKQEKEERLKNTSQIDFVQERAEENKTFFKLAPKEEKVQVAEKEEIQQEEKIKNMRKR